MTLEMDRYATERCATDGLLGRSVVRQGDLAARVRTKVMRGEIFRNWFRLQRWKSSKYPGGNRQIAVKYSHG
jgi:hypothetical protein